MTRLMLAIACLAAFVGAAGAQDSATTRTTHMMLRLEDVAWRQVRPGVHSAVLAGRPAADTGHYSVAIRLADGEWLQPHFHPNAKRVVVLQGTLLMGMGDCVVAALARPLSTGSFSIVPANAHHFEGARGETVILLYGRGPLQTTYVDSRGRPIAP